MQIETGSIQKAETLQNSITEKLGAKRETHIMRQRKSRLKIINIPEEISTHNIQKKLMAQKPEIGIVKCEIIPKFTYETKRHQRNILIGVSVQTRKKRIENKVKIGWINNSIDDYLIATRCFRSSRFNQRMRE